MEDVNIDLFFSSHLTEGKIEYPSGFLSWMAALCTIVWRESERSLTDSRTSSHNLSQASIDSVPAFEHHLSVSLLALLSLPQTLRSSVCTWTGHTHNTLIKLSKASAQWHVCCMPWGQVLHRHTNIHLCTLCEGPWLCDKVNWFSL